MKVTSITVISQSSRFVRTSLPVRIKLKNPDLHWHSRRSVLLLMLVCSSYGSRLLEVSSQRPPCSKNGAKKTWVWGWISSCEKLSDSAKKNKKSRPKFKNLYQLPSMLWHFPSSVIQCHPTMWLNLISSTWRETRHMEQECSVSFSSDNSNQSFWLMRGQK